MDTLHHKRANFQCEIPHILGSGQKTNRTNFRRFEICTLHASRSAHFSLLLRLEYHVFALKILHTGGGNHLLHPDIFFGIILQFKFDFFWNLQNDLPGAREPFLPHSLTMCFIIFYQTWSPFIFYLAIYILITFCG